ncbi:hypothetical protein ABK040_013547 [Willaertia magna]
MNTVDKANFVNNNYTENVQPIKSKALPVLIRKKHLSINSVTPSDVRLAEDMFKNSSIPTNSSDSSLKGENVKHFIRKLCSVHLCLFIFIVSLTLISTITIFAVTFAIQQKSIEEYSLSLGQQIKSRISDYISSYMGQPFQIVKSMAIKLSTENITFSRDYDKILNVMFSSFITSNVTYVSYTRCDDLFIGMSWDEYGYPKVEIYRDGFFANTTVRIDTFNGIVNLPDPLLNPGSPYPNHMDDIVWWVDAKEKGKITWSSFYADLYKEFWISAYWPLYNFTYNPITKKTEKFMHTLLSVDIQLTFLSKYLVDNINLSKNSFVYIVESKTSVIVASSKIKEDELFLFDLNAAYHVRTRRLNESKIEAVREIGKRIYREYGVNLSIVTIPTFQHTIKENYFQIETTKISDIYGLDWTVFVFIAMTDFIQPSIDLRNVTIIVNCVVIVFSIIVSIIISRMITQPLQKLGKKMDEIRKISLNVRNVQQFKDSVTTLSAYYKETPREERVVPEITFPQEEDYHVKFLSRSLFYEVSVLQKHFSKMSHAVEGFMKYVPVEIVSTFLKGDPSSFELGVSEKRIAIFFSDIANFTSICESLEPTDVVVILSQYFEKISEIIYQNKGILDKYIGDAIMALFGAPVTFDDYAYYCCNAAYEIQLALKKLNFEYIKQRIPILSTRIGIAVGDVLLGNIGSSFRLSYTCLGDSVNLAARLEGLNKLYGTSILVSDSCYKVIKDRFVCRLIDMVAVKGKKYSTKVYEVICRRDHSDESKLEFCDAYQTILNEYYWKKDFKNALEEFKSFANTYPKDKASKEMIRRCNEIISKDIDFENWDGVYVATSK